MKVVRYTAQRVLRLSDVDFNLAGRNLFLVGGKNSQGKTSALTALLMALCGRSGLEKYPEIQLKEGEDEGQVRVELAGDDGEPPKLTVELKIKRKRGGQVIEEFRLLDEKDRELKQPRELLKRLYELRAFDPLAFERLEGKAQKALLAQVVGLDFSEHDAEYKRLYQEREDVNREGKKLKAQVEGMPEYRDAPAAEVSTADLLEELKRRQATNKENADQRALLKELCKLTVGCENSVISTEREVAAARLALERAEAELEVQRKRFADSKKHSGKQALSCDLLVDADEEQVREQIANSGEQNRKLGANQAKAKSAKRLDELRDESQALTDKLKDIEKAKADAIAAAKWPVPGLSFDSDGVLFDGLPFGQASKSKRVLASVRIGMALNPKLRLLVCEDGSDLDSDTLAALDELLKQEDFQMILELVTRTSADEELCAVVIQDGKVR